MIHRWDNKAGENGPTQIDEVRLSNVLRTADWIKQSYEMVKNQSTYVSTGSESNNWWNDDWTRCPNLTNANVGTTTLTDFPAYSTPAYGRTAGPGSRRGRYP